MQLSAKENVVNASKANRHDDTVLVARNGRSSRIILLLFIESFTGRLRDELLHETPFTSLAQVRAVLASKRGNFFEEAHLCNV